MNSEDLLSCDTTSSSCSSSPNVTPKQARNFREFGGAAAQRSRILQLFTHPKSNKAADPFKGLLSECNEGDGDVIPCIITSDCSRAQRGISSECWRRIRRSTSGALRSFHRPAFLLFICSVIYLEMESEAPTSNMLWLWRRIKELCGAGGLRVVSRWGRSTRTHHHHQLFSPTVALPQLNLP